MIEVVSSPPMNTVQDLGTETARPFGFGPCGAMDPVALRLANALLGNAENAAGLEIQMFPVRLRFRKRARFALTGCAQGTLGSRRLPPWWCTTGERGDSLLIEPLADGARGYLSVGGGIDVPAVLGSRSTRPSGFGGLDGRAVRAGDLLRPLERNRRPAKTASYGALQNHAPRDAATGAITLRFLPGPEFGSLDAASMTALSDTTWRLDTRSDRQGFRLNGPALSRDDATEMRSYPLIPGVVQLTPGGTLIIQMNDTNAAGGYPRIGIVIEADLPRLAQTRPSQPLRLMPCVLEEAVEASREVERHIQTVREDVHRYLAEAPR